MEWKFIWDPIYIWPWLRRLTLKNNRCRLPYSSHNGRLWNLQHFSYLAAVEIKIDQVDELISGDGQCWSTRVSSPVCMCLKRASPRCSEISNDQYSAFNNYRQSTLIVTFKYIAYTIEIEIHSCFFFWYIISDHMQPCFRNPSFILSSPYTYSKYSSCLKFVGTIGNGEWNIDLSISCQIRTLHVYVLRRLQDDFEGSYDFPILWNFHSLLICILFCHWSHRRIN